MKLSRLTILAAVAALIGCGSSQIVPEHETVTPNKIVELRASWVKDKGKKWDVEFTVTNKSESDIIIMLNDMQCSRGDATGMLKHTFFNTGERAIDFRKGQMKQFRMVCTTGPNVKGDYKIVINRIYDNPTADGASKGKVIGERITWSTPDK